MSKYRSLLEFMDLSPEEHLGIKIHESLRGKVAILPISCLEEFSSTRETQKPLLQKLRENIKKYGYNYSFLFSIVKQGHKYVIADGNHRYKILKELRIKHVPCRIYRNVDPLKIHILANSYRGSSWDLFDYINLISKLEEKEGLSEKEIAKLLGWKEGEIKNYKKIQKEIDSRVLKFAENYNKNPKYISFKFTEEFFRKSLFYELDSYNQMICLNNFFLNLKAWKGIEKSPHIRHIRRYSRHIINKKYYSKN